MHLGGRPLLDIARFELPAASCTVLSGRNGAGKTTLLKIAAGLLRPDALRDRNVHENVAYGLRRAGVPAAEREPEVRMALAWAGLEHLAERNARHLSGGERQRLALARARVLSPEVLLLDEPTTNMDEEATEQSLLLIRDMVAGGMGVIVASHDRHVVEQLGDLHLNLADGTLHIAGRAVDGSLYGERNEVL
jgi:tungstate transport system ATP-binding protein